MIKIKGLIFKGRIASVDPLRGFDIFFSVSWRKVLLVFLAFLSTSVFHCVSNSQDSMPQEEGEIFYIYDGGAFTQEELYMMDNCGICDKYKFF